MSAINRNIRGKKARRAEGAAMLVVMLILLMATAAAAISVQAASLEMRSSGYARRELQTKYVAEAALATAHYHVNLLGAWSLWHAMNNNTFAGPVDLSNFHEPNIIDPKKTYRFISDDYLSDDYTGVDPNPPVPLNRPPVSSAEDSTGSFGPKQAYKPWFIVDIYDCETWPVPNPGYRADSNMLMFTYANFTARGYTIPNDAEVTGPVNDPLTAGQANQTAFTACGVAQLGPFTP